MASSQNKTAFLGVSYGTACHRLRKSIMFQLVRECQKDICHVCGEKIECVEDFSD